MRGRDLTLTDTRRRLLLVDGGSRNGREERRNPRVLLVGSDALRPDPARVLGAMRTMAGDHGLRLVTMLDAVSPSPPERRVEALQHGTLRLLAGARALIANLSPLRGPSPEEGAVFAVGFAAARGIPVFAWSSCANTANGRTHFDRAALLPHLCVRRRPDGPRDWDDIEVEDHGLRLSLLLAHTVSNTVHPGFEEALRACAQHMKVRRRA